MKKLALLLLPLIGCEKDIDKKTYLIENAVTIIDAGDPMVDGCGWLLRTANGKTLVPQTLDTKYKTNNLKVNIKYEVIKNGYICAWSSYDYPVIEIKSIQK